MYNANFACFHQSIKSHCCFIVAAVWISISESGLACFWTGTDSVLHRATMYPSPGSVSFSRTQTRSIFIFSDISLQSRSRLTACILKWNSACVPGLSSELEELMVEGLLLQVSLPETQQLYRLLLSGLPTTNTSHTEHTPYLTQKHSSPQREVMSVMLSCCLASKIKSLIENNNQGLKWNGKEAQHQLPTLTKHELHNSRRFPTLTANILYCIQCIYIKWLSQ